MSYVKSVLGFGEDLIYLGHGDLFPYLPYLALAFLLLVSPVFIAWPAFPALAPLIGIVLAAIIVGNWRAMELGITTKRVIVKTGFIHRRTQELLLSRVEGVDVDQTLTGRLLGFGCVLIRGVGTKLDPVNYVKDPSGFKDAFFAAAERSGQAVAPSGKRAA